MGSPEQPPERLASPMAIAWRWVYMQWAMGAVCTAVLFAMRLIPPPILLILAIHMVNVGIGLMTVRRSLDAVRAAARRGPALASVALSAPVLIYWIWSLVAGGVLLV